MISLQAYFGQAHVRAEALARLDNIGASEPRLTSLVEVFLGPHLHGRLSRIEAVCRATGFTPSLISVCDAILAGLPDQQNLTFARAVLNVPVGFEVSSIAQDFIDWALDDAIAQLGGPTLIARALEQPSLFTQFEPPQITRALQKKQDRRAVRLAARLGQEPEQRTDLAAHALCRAINQLPATRHGEVIAWLADGFEAPTDQLWDYAQNLSDRMV